MYGKIELVKGDVIQRIAKYLEENQHPIIALLFMDFDLHDPTRIALETLLPRIPKGGIIAFDELNNPGWPGETLALIEEFTTLNRLELRKFHFDSNIAYMKI